MTITIKDSNNNVIGTSESIFINTKDLSVACVSTKKDIQGNNISNLVRTPLYYDGEIILDFELINPVNLNTKADQEYTIYYTQTEENRTQIIILKECKFNKDKGTCETIQVLYPDNLKSVFKHYFPKLTPSNYEDNKLLTANIDKNELIRLTIYQSKSDLYTSDLWTNNHFLYLHQSTDLNELMQVTKQKLNDMFADWMSKVN